MGLSRVHTTDTATPAQGQHRSSAQQPQSETHDRYSTSSSRESNSSRCSSPSPEAMEHHSTTSVSLDRHQPMIFKVGLLGDKYWSWVHKAEPGYPRFFKSDLAEAVTKTPWWIVPLIWLPVFSMFAYLTFQQLPLHETVSLMLLGVVGWQLMEYSIHRFLFHAHSDSYWGITLHFIFHGCHHKYPNDKLRLVFPPVPGALVVMLVYSCLNTVLPAQQALAVLSGVGLGYVAYDCLHYTIHNGRWLPAGPLQHLRIQHIKHHKEHNHSYGISSSCFDYLFRTGRNSLLHQNGDS